ncbi:hypothetical protein AMTRI_Chr06g191430 [Amborella trichopoda]
MSSPSIALRTVKTTVLSLNKAIAKLTRKGQIAEARRIFNGSPCRTTVTWNSMLSGYVHALDLSEARKLFDEMPHRDVVSWNLMISGFAKVGELREARKVFEASPERDAVSYNTLISGYGSTGFLSEARALFDSMPSRTVASWNAMISCYLKNGELGLALKLFEDMPERDSWTLNAMVSGLVRWGNLDMAAGLLERVGDGGIDAYNTLLAGYAQSGRLEEAWRFFDEIPHKVLNCANGKPRSLARNVVSWNSMMMGYVRAGKLSEAQKLFDDMPEKDQISWNTMISGYVQASDLAKASSLFRQMPEPDCHSWNSMISGYSKIGEPEMARILFDAIPQKSLVSWNSILSGFEQNGWFEEAIGFFLQMREAGEKPDRHTFSCILSVCAAMAALVQGKQLHQQIVKTLISDIPIGNSLITMYARCGDMGDAMKVFNAMTHRDVVSWNALMWGYAHHGHANEAILLFKEMKKSKVSPTHITFISVLSACNHGGLVDEACEFFDSMIREHGIDPMVEHFASMVDILSRHGKLEEAMAMIQTMPMKPDRAVWGAMLSACRNHGDIKLAELAAEELLKLEPESSAPYILLSNLYADSGRWCDAVKVRNDMEKARVRKQPGYSWIAVQSQVEVFVAGDQGHSQAEEIYGVIEIFNRQIKDLGLVVDMTDFNG